jgi:hypothetical protein
MSAVMSASRAAGDRARAELLAGAGRSDGVIAEVAGCACSTVIEARRELERSGQIAGHQAAGRTSRPRPLARRPYIPDLPRAPDFSQGRCTAHPSPQWWSSRDQARAGLLDVRPGGHSRGRQAGLGAGGGLRLRWQPAEHDRR